MIKMTMTLIILVIFTLCQAPALSDRQRDEKIVRLKYEQEWERFIHELGRRESNNCNYAINSIGCMGRFQIAPGTLKHLGYSITAKQFKDDPACFPEGLQRQILIQLFEINSTSLKHYMDNYIGLEIGGVLITKAGILAASHLSGAGGVKIYLLTMGRTNRSDINNTSVKKYLADFSKFEL